MILKPTQIYPSEVEKYKGEAVTTMENVKVGDMFLREAKSLYPAIVEISEIKGNVYHYTYNKGKGDVTSNGTNNYNSIKLYYIKGVDYKMKAKKKETQTTDTSWSFNITSLCQINYLDILNCMSYSNPVAILKGSDGNPIAVVIHESVRAKIANCRKKISLGRRYFDVLGSNTDYFETGDVIYTDSLNTFNKVQQLVKDVKNSRWLCDNKRKVEVTIELLNCNNN